MPGTTNWDSSETWERVVAAILATGVKIDLKATALYYGTTYDTLENRFRKVKKLSTELKREVEGGERGEVKAKPATPRKPKTPKKDALSSVTNGRVSKVSPSKKKAVKQEQLESAGSSFFDNLEEDVGMMGSFTTNGVRSFDTENGLFEEFQ